MPDWVFFAFPVLALFALLPVVWAWRLAWNYWRHSGPTPAADGPLPRAAVILSLRGADPSLLHCLRGLLRQDYPCYSVRIVVDSDEDPAWDMIRSVLAEGQPHDDVLVSVLTDRRETCSLKVSAQLQALAELEEDVEVVAFIDADSVPAADWLRALVLPLADPRVGASTGIRWFAPPDHGWGNLVRHAYNSASFTQMYVFHMPWGGAFAMRKETIYRSGLVDHWANCFCEDISAYGPLRKVGLKLAFVPAATQFNRESIDMAGATRFMLRQLFCVRMHHVHWLSLLSCNLLNAAALTASALVCAAAACAGELAVSALFGGLLGTYAIGLLGAFLTGEWLVRRNMRGRIADVPPYPITWKIVPAAIMAQALSIHCMMATLTLRRIDWRGVHYAVEGPEKIRLVEYSPYLPPQTLDPTRSVV
jgi:hypothetical protein